MKGKMPVGLTLVMLAAFSVGWIMRSDDDDKKKKGALSSSDAQFLVEASQGGMLEVRLGDLASDKSTNSEVKKFGEMMKEDHDKVNSQIKDLASRKGLKLDASLNEDHMDKYSELSKLSGMEFNKEYIDHMVDDHEKDVDKFEKMSKDADDQDVRQFASKNLSTLRNHLKEAKRIQENLDNMSKKM